MGRGSSSVWTGGAGVEGAGPSPEKVCKVFERFGLGLDLWRGLLQKLCKSAGRKSAPAKSGFCYGGCGRDVAMRRLVSFRDALVVWLVVLGVPCDLRWG
jgi:hypothetical protein